MSLESRYKKPGLESTVSIRLDSSTGIRPQGEGDRFISRAEQSRKILPDYYSYCFIFNFFLIALITLSISFFKIFISSVPRIFHSLGFKALA